MKVSTGTPPPAPSRPNASRGRWPLRDYPAVVWLLAAVVVAIAHQAVPSARWLMVHLVLLGAITHSIMVWSTYFTQALLKTPPTLDDRRVQARRLWLLLLGVLAVLVGVPTAQLALVVAGAAAVVVAVVWHAVQLVRRLRRALPGRFRITIRYYLAACAFLPVGITAGVLLARGLPGDWHGRLLVAHTMVNLLGWVGLTVTGTLLTLWPTILRTRIDERAERWAKQALPVLAGALLLTLAGTLVDQRPLALAGIVVYALGICWWGRALLRPARTRPPRSFAAASVAAGLVWLLVGLVVVAITVARADSWAEVANAFTPATAIFVVGVAAQVLLGALSYLLPVAIGGGPAKVKAATAAFDSYGALRIMMANAALVLCLLPVPSWVLVVCSVLVLVALAWFLPLVGVALAARRKAGEPGTLAPPPRAAEQETTFWRRGQLMGALVAVLLAVSVGVAVDPAAAGLGTTSDSGADSAAVAATGETTTVQVSAQDMRFVPDTVTVPAGDRLVIELTNDDPTTVHDLTVGGVTSDRLAPGESQTLDVGVVGEDLDGWCTVAGHRQMGMVFTVLAEGGAAAAPEPTAGTGDAAGTSPDHGDAQDQGPSAVDTPIEAVVPAELPPLTDETTHRLTLAVEEVELEVAPGVWQRRWTFGGTVPGPTLHGRVGDTFEITLVNDGSMGHSIDFHAGALAPDEPMRTIAPGESLTYTFTAERAGIWMYHCATEPMSVHIGAGMFGAVVIEPDDLPEVDRSYVLVQSETFLGADHEAGEASEVDADKVLAEDPDYVTFNGIAGQYDQEPLTARTGETVRFWVLDAGPNRPSSFHVVGGQFDTVYSEGAYLLKDGQGPLDGAGHGGAQALALAAAQGGFVELTLPEAGHYPFISHVMVDAERGAHGILAVTD
ncbi:multicopper oxidase domain-containing protein [Ruania albidiflava]|uniref:multicopper oxidase domain-containing protein n=1 Tax=Ruania albidiflava TaxID=366586 RepID=UPI0003B4D8C8|nr:multicopper oxidase domain-containing protein [Ruania albidiflava]